ncbi:hypothetical protein BGW41_003604 [Actinomortierella wolfii]|nr:hypothetical protein BGW41_003604 [Actinomortierella wolfii]
MLYQEFRQGSEVARIQVLTDSETNKQYIRLDDIQEVFPDAFRFCVDGNSVSFMFDADGVKYDNPRRVPHVPGRVLDVIGRAGSHSPQTSPAISRTPSPFGILQHQGTLNEGATPPSVVLPHPLHLTSPSSSTAPYSTSISAFYSSSSSMTLTAAATALSTFDESVSMGDGYYPQQQPTSQIQNQQEVQQALSQARLHLDAVQSRLSSGNLHDLVEFQQRIHSDIARLEQLVLALQASHAQHHDAVMANFMKMLQLQQQALDRLGQIQASVERILVQSFELVEYTIPRLFVVLPDTRRRKWDPTRILSNRFRLYFLCESGSVETPGLTSAHRHIRQESPFLSSMSTTSYSPRTLPSPSSSPGRSPSSKEGSNMRSIHIAPHEGYEIIRPTQFFEKYGHYILGLLHILKYGLATASIAVPAIDRLQVVDGVKQVANNIQTIASDTLQGIDHSIEYLERILGRGATGSGGSQIGGVSGDRHGYNIQALEGADLRRLESFLRVRDPERVLGNLYRTMAKSMVSADHGEEVGHVHWVCLDHFHWPYREQAIQQLVSIIRANSPSSFDMHRRKASVTLRSSQSLAEFLGALTNCPVVYELELILDFAFTYSDLSAVRHALESSNVQALSIDGCENKESGPAAAVGLLSRPPGKGRFDPILRMLATNMRLQSLRLANLAKFSKHSSSSSLNIPIKPTASGGMASPNSGLPSSIQSGWSSPNWMRVFHYSHEMDESDQNRLATILSVCPCLRDVRLGNQYDSYVYPELWRALAGLRELEVLHLYGVTDMVDDASSVSNGSSSEAEESEEDDNREDTSRARGQKSGTEDGEGASGNMRMKSLSPAASMASSVSSASALSGIPSQPSQQSSRWRGYGKKRRSRSKEALSFVDYFAQNYKNTSYGASRDKDGDVDMGSISPTTATLLQPLESHRPRRLRELVLVRSGLSAIDVLHWLRVLTDSNDFSSSLSPSSGELPCNLEVLQVELVGVYPLDLQALFFDHCPQITHRLTRLWLDVATVDERNVQSLRMALRSLPLLTHLGLVLEDACASASSRESSRQNSLDDHTTDNNSHVVGDDDGEEQEDSRGITHQLQQEPLHHHHHIKLPKEPSLTTLILTSIVDLPAISHLYLGRFDCRDLCPILLTANAHPRSRLQSLTLDNPMYPREGRLTELLQQLTTFVESASSEEDSGSNDDDLSSGQNEEEDITRNQLTHLALINCFEPDGWLADLITRLDFAPLRTLILNFVALGPDSTAALMERAPEFLVSTSLTSTSTTARSSVADGSKQRRPLQRLMLYGIDEMSMDIEKFLANFRKRALAGLPTQLQQQQEQSLEIKHGFISSHDMFEWMQWLD